MPKARLPKNNPRSQAGLVSGWKYPVGAAVVVRKDDGSEVATTTRSLPWLLGGHTAVILLAGISGGYALSRVRLADAGTQPLTRAAA